MRRGGCGSISDIGSCSSASISMGLMAAGLKGMHGSPSRYPTRNEADSTTLSRSRSRSVSQAPEAEKVVSTLGPYDLIR